MEISWVAIIRSNQGDAKKGTKVRLKSKINKPTMREAEVAFIEKYGMKESDLHDNIDILHMGI